MEINESILLKENNSIDISKILIRNRSIIYPILFYIAGLIAGSYIYNIIDNSTIKAVIEESAKGSSGGFLNLFIDNLCLFLTIFIICLVLGLCIIGYSLVNFIPLIFGIVVALKLSYYYVNYGAKGVGYSILIIIPGVIMFLQILLYTIELSTLLSKYIHNIAIRKSGIIEEINLKSYLIKFCLYGVLVITTSALSALLSYLFSSLITL